MHLTALPCIGIQARPTDGQLLQERIMTIPTIEYKGYELHAYTQKVFPTYHDPYANGPKRYSAIVKIDTIPSSGERRYSIPSNGAAPATASDAIDRAMQYGKDIVDGTVKANEL